MIHEDGFNFDSREAHELYLEFKEIPDNRLSIQSKADAVITADMMYRYLKIAYKISGYGEQLEN